MQLMKRIKKHNNSGITLVALVVTIVVLLILAGVSINLVIGQNGLMNRAKEAKEQTLQARKEEEKLFSDIDEKITEYIDIDWNEIFANARKHSEQKIVIQ